MSKTVEYPNEGVIVKIPDVHENVFVERKGLKSIGNYPATPGVFDPIKLVINIAFFKLDPKTGKKNYQKKLNNPKVKLRIYYDAYVKKQASGRPKKLAWWDKTRQMWIPIASKNKSSPSKKWEGYGDATTSGWDDPPIGWGI